VKVFPKNFPSWGTGSVVVIGPVVVVLRNVHCLLWCKIVVSIAIPLWLAKVLAKLLHLCQK